MGKALLQYFSLPCEIDRKRFICDSKTRVDTVYIAFIMILVKNRFRKLEDSVV